MTDLPEMSEDCRKLNEQALAEFNGVTQMEESPGVVNIFLDHLPSRDLSPNARVHWSVRHRASRQLKAEVYYIAKQLYHGKPIEKAVVSYEFQLDSKRRRDSDNLIASMKSALDGLVEAGVLVDDDSRHVSIGHVSVTAGETNITRIEIKKE